MYYVGFFPNLSVRRCFLTGLFDERQNALNKPSIVYSPINHDVSSAIASWWKITTTDTIILGESMVETAAKILLNNRFDCSSYSSSS